MRNDSIAERASVHVAYELARRAEEALEHALARRDAAQRDAEHALALVNRALDLCLDSARNHEWRLAS